MPSFLQILIAGVLRVLLLPVATFAPPAFGTTVLPDNGDTRTVIAVPSFGGDPAAAATITSVITADLERSSRFRVPDTIDRGIDEAQRVIYSDWKARGVSALIVGSVRPTSDGRHETRFRLYDVQKEKEVAAKALIAATKDLSNVAHQISDQVFEKLTGKPGAFSTRLAYVAKRADRYYVMIANADGGNPQPALASPKPISSLAWSPTGMHIAYVSHEISAPGKERPHPVVYTHSLASGLRGAAFIPPAASRSLSIAWSPDGTRLAIISNEGDKSAFYLVSPDGKDSKLTSISKSEDANPSFSADGQQIYFDSNRSGTRQIYRLQINGGIPERLTRGSNESFAPTVAPDGRTVAYIAKEGGRDRVALMDPSSGTSSILSDSPSARRLTFAANSEFVVFRERSDIGDILKAISVGTQRSAIWTADFEVAGGSDFALSPYAGKAQLPGPGPSLGSQADAALVRGWANRIRNKIRSNMALPPGTPPNAIAEFSVVQLPKGEIVKTTLISSSGFAPFDTAVERAIVKSSPLPEAPTPADFIRELRIRYQASDSDIGDAAPYIGITIHDVTKELADAIGLKNAAGALVGSTDKEGPAATAGLERGDIALRVGTQAIETAKDFMSSIAAGKPGDTIPIQIWRKGELKTVPVTLTNRPATNVTLLPSPDAPYRNARPIYPAESRRKEEEGRTMLRVLVDAQGLPQEVEVKESSGFARLDQAALDAVRTWHFMPGKKDGVPTAGWIQIPILFRLE